ncbi:MAG: sigma-54 dependent transcriptional regulator [Pseudomonadota bacterium]
MDQTFRIKIIDDEEAMRESLAGWLEKQGYQVTTAGSGAEALSQLAREACDLILLDIKMPEMDGLQLLPLIKAENPQVLVIMITAYGSIETAVESMKQGANDYLLKPFDPEELILLIEKMIEHKNLLEENMALKERLAEMQQPGLEDLILKSSAMQQVLEMIKDVAPTEVPILITGETGTGKELVARAIHSLSPRVYNPFVVLNCGAQTETLLESELFGHEQGAFTGAVKTRRGRLEMADRGTLFLDEVGEIPLKMQIDLLRVLEERKFLRVGGSQPVESDFRLISATHRDLPQLIQKERFRQDFFYRINVITIHIPPLRERPEDIELLAEYFLTKVARETGKEIEGFTPQARQILTSYTWPGNVRELKNVIERAVVINRRSVIGVQELTFLGSAQEVTPGQVTLQEMEVNHLRRTLESLDWNITRAAKILGLDRGTLSRKVMRYGLKRAQ